MHSSSLACKIPWIEWPGGLQSLRSESDVTERLSTHARMNGFILMLSNMLNTVSTFFNTTWVRMVIFLQPTGDVREAAHSWRPLTGISRSPKPQPVQRGATSGDTWESLVAQVCPGK